MCKFTPSDDVMEMFLSGFLIEEDPEAVVNPHEHYPLADLVKRSDGPRLFLAISEKASDKSKLDKHYKYMFESAVRSGTCDMMEVKYRYAITRRSRKFSYTTVVSSEARFRGR